MHKHKQPREEEKEGFVLFWLGIVSQSETLRSDFATSVFKLKLKLK
jgi:hypothetical protein